VSRWGQYGERPEPAAVNESLFASFAVSEWTEVACAPDGAWDLITDIERIGEFSPECIDAKWIDGASEPGVGARFEGTNHVVTTYQDEEIDFTWIRVCTVTAATRPTLFAYAVGDRFDATPACDWEVQIEPTANGCRITQRFQHRPQGLSGTRLAADSDPERAAEQVRERTAELKSGIGETLQRMTAVLEPKDASTAP